MLTVKTININVRVLQKEYILIIRVSVYKTTNLRVSKKNK